MMPRLSDRLKRVVPSGTVAFSQRVNDMIASGRDIIDLSVGEPHFPAPAEVINATCRALKEGRTRYGSVPGLMELRTAIGHRIANLPADRVMVTNGAKQALYQLFQAICSNEDEVLIPRPCWVSFPQQVRLAGGTPIFVDSSTGEPNAAALADAVTERSRAIIINTPNNPTGAVYSETFLSAVARLAEAHHLWVIFDAAYDQFIFDADGDALPALFSKMEDRLAWVGSFSKTFSMTGFRIGYVAAPTALIKAMTTIQGHNTGNVCTFAQYGALAALALDESTVTDRCDAYRQCRDTAVTVMRRFFDVPSPGGAFYLFADVSRHVADNETAMVLADRLLTEAGVALVPGDDFGAPKHLRLSFAVSPETLNTGLDRITDALA